MRVLPLNLPFNKFVRLTLKISIVALAVVSFFLIWQTNNYLLWGLFIGLGVGMWNLYFLEKRLSKLKPDKSLVPKFQLAIGVSSLVRIFTVIAVLWVTSRISLIMLIATAVGIIAVWGIFAGVVAVFVLKSLRREKVLKAKVH
ncbi:MAG: hypothetical protein STSR0004_04860 [Peptococcaceae bacterium]